MILYDPTEGREGTLVPEIKDFGIPMPGLEAATGADFAILKEDIWPDCLSIPQAEEVGRLLFSNLPAIDISEQVGINLPSILRIQKFWELANDGILIQRKSGSDLIGSIPWLDMILEKMTIWTRQPWLLVIGNFQATPNGKTFVNGRASDFAYNAVQGALDAWQERGGYLSVIEKDILFTEWIKRKERRLVDRRDYKIVVYRQRLQILVGPDNHSEWRTTLMTFRGIGGELATAIADQCGTLANSLVMLSDEDTLRNPSKPKGLGIITLEHARMRLGLMPGQRLEIKTELKDNE